MSKQVFNSGRRGSIAGTSPQGRRTVATSRRASVVEKRPSQKSEEFRFKKYCEEVFADRFEGLESADPESQRKIVAEVFREICTSKECALPNRKKFALAVGIASLLFASFAGEHVVPDLLENIHFDSVFRIAGGAVIGGAVGGPVGVVVGATSQMIPRVEGAPIPSVEPKSSKHLRGGVEVKEEKAGEIMGRYSVEELIVPEDRIFVVTPDGGDWVFTLKGLMPIKDFLVNGFEFELPFSLIKSRDLADVVARGDLEGFERIIRKAIAETKNSFFGVEQVFQASFNEAEVKEGQRGAKSYNINAIAEKISKAIDYLSAEDVYDCLSLAKKTNSDRSSREFNEKLKHHLADLIFPRFESEESRIKMLEELRMDPRVNAENAYYAEAKKNFKSKTEFGLRNTPSEDRIEKTKIFASNPRAKVVVGHPALEKSVKLESYNAGMVPKKQRDVLFVLHPENVATYSHESMHVYDDEKCLVEDDVIKIFNRTIPCVTGREKDLSEGVKLTKDLDQARNLDMKFLESASIDVPTKQFIQRGLVDCAVEEIIPVVTQTFQSSYAMLKITPNIAVVRVRTIVKDRPEAQLYAAMLECDGAAVAKLIAKDPAILDRTYDQHPLHELPSYLERFGFDRLVMSKFKKSDEKNCYVKMKEFVQGEYEKYQTIKKYSFSSRADSGAEL